MPDSTKILTVLVALFGIVYIVLLIVDDDQHRSSHTDHHHHYDHVHVEYVPVLGVAPENITFVEVRSPEHGLLLRADAASLELYRGDVQCQISESMTDLNQLRVSFENQIFTRWQLFFSNMTPDAHIEPDQQFETYGLDAPVGCISIGVERDDSREEVVFILFGEQTVQEFNQYIKIEGEEDVLLVPRYFWQQARDMMLGLTSR